MHNVEKFKMNHDDFLPPYIHVYGFILSKHFFVLVVILKLCWGTTFGNFFSGVA